jgi:hypothetical protein
MINLKRNSKKELALASGKRTRASLIYQPNQSTDFKISQRKFSDLLTCPRCFYMDRVLGLDLTVAMGLTLHENFTA